MPLHDHVQLYLREMARTALLTAEEEVDLAKRYEAGLEAERVLAEGRRLAVKRKRQLHQVDRDGKRAKERLQRSDDSVQTIARAVGFHDRAYFSRVFRKVTGVAPHAYRDAP